ncbi:MAG: DegT/DnrJ/EryC1/StrS aminotransferase family protein [Bacteroidales bacterium]|jgi:dTDP-4-amino-4,6-dideoxygalactose transaminase|nr:DegT/DnrJ/EryC1/StrS aminotransferase family protein [Bacteroidales bacterium]
MTNEMIPFSPPRIDQQVIDEVIAALKSGWITTGPRTKEFEKKLAAYCNVQRVLCLNSASAGLELMLRWFGVGEGDEVIVPAYTYTATASVVLHCNATPVMVDVDKDFLIDVEAVRKAITPRTKVIMPVDIAGFPCDYDALNTLVRQQEMTQQFTPHTAEQQTLGRILILSDAAHSIGAVYKGKRTGSLTDISVFSFHAVKNLTTAEGGAVALNLPRPFDPEEVYKYLCVKSLHGQNKDALAKAQVGNWRYDVIEAGYKCNMTDILAAVGLVELARYDSDMLPRRRAIFEAYHQAFASDPRFEVPCYETEDKVSSYHVYPLRINYIDEATRDQIMQSIFEQKVSVNVHFIPLPMLTAYKNLGYNINLYPVAYHNYSREISLPVYYDLTDEQVQRVIQSVKRAVNENI